MLPLPHISSIFKFFSQINMCKCFPYFKKVSPTLSPSQATLFLCFSLIPLLPHLPSSIPHLAFDLSTLLERKAAGVSFKGYTRGLLILRSQGFSSLLILYHLCSNDNIGHLKIWSSLLSFVHHTLLFLCWLLMVASQLLHSSPSSVCAENEGISLGSRSVIFFFLHTLFQYHPNTRDSHIFLSLSLTLTFLLTSRPIYQNRFGTAPFRHPTGPLDSQYPNTNLINSLKSSAPFPGHHQSLKPNTSMSSSTPPFLLGPI